MSNKLYLIIDVTTIILKLNILFAILFIIPTCSIFIINYSKNHLNTCKELNSRYIFYNS